MTDDLAHRLIRARSGHGWSQADLAEVSGVAAAQISRYEAGRAKPRPEVVAKLAKALAVGFDWLREGVGPIEVGAEVPVYPASQSREISVDLDPETHALLKMIADREGISVEMAFKKMILLAISDMGDDLQKLGNAIRSLKEGK